MSAPSILDADEITRKYLLHKAAAGIRKVGGEVRFIKDRSDDQGQWAFAPPGASKREITHDFKYEPRNLKPLARCLRATNSALGFALSAHKEFLKLQSRKVSGDGLLGGKGYVQKIPDMRRQFMNVAEALSALSDTIGDEVQAPHWAEISRNLPKADQTEITEDLDEADEAKNDPNWAEDEMED